MHRDPASLIEIDRLRRAEGSPYEGQFVTLRVRDERFWVRAWARLRRRAGPFVMRDYVVVRADSGKLELTPIEFSRD